MSAGAVCICLGIIAGGMALEMGFWHVAHKLSHAIATKPGTNTLRNALIFVALLAIAVCVIQIYCDQFGR